SVEAGIDLPDGLRATSFGVSRPDVRTDEIVRQATGACPSEFVYTVDIEHGALLEVSTTSAVPNLDVDIYLITDNGDGVLTCANDPLLASSTGQTADEFVSVTMPADGRYFVMIDGYFVPGGESTF